MCNANCILFGANNIKDEEIRDRDVLEVGSLDCNGSFRSYIQKRNPQKYLGVDIMMGEGVDEICKVEDLLKKYGENSFDLIISTELLEHIKDWRKAISNMKKVCREDGIILITTRSPGFAYHAYPYDYWRYTKRDMKYIFSDFEILNLESEVKDPGVFIKAKKPKNFKEKDLSDYCLFSIVSGKKEKEILNKHKYNLIFFKIIIKERIKIFLKKLA